MQKCLNCFKPVFYLKNSRGAFVCMDLETKRPHIEVCHKFKEINLKGFHKNMVSYKEMQKCRRLDEF